MKITVNLNCYFCRKDFQSHVVDNGSDMFQVTCPHCGKKWDEFLSRDGKEKLN